MAGIWTHAWDETWSEPHVGRSFGFDQSTWEVRPTLERPWLVYGHTPGMKRGLSRM